jgi:hypothetical protein
VRRTRRLFVRGRAAPCRKQIRHALRDSNDSAYATPLQHRSDYRKMGKVHFGTDTRLRCFHLAANAYRE